MRTPARSASEEAPRAPSDTRWDQSQAYHAGRFLERADGIGRAIEYTLQTARATKPVLPGQTSRSLLIPMLHDRQTFDRYLEKDAELDEEEVFQLLALDRSKSISIASCLSRALACATEGVAFLPIDALGPLQLLTEPPPSATSEPLLFLEKARTAVHAAFGAIDCGMKRDETFDWFWLGVSLERADTTLKIIAAKRISPRAEEPATQTRLDREQWDFLGRSLSAPGRTSDNSERDEAERTANGLQQFVLDERFPRSVRYCVGRADERLRGLAPASGRIPIDPSTQALGRLRAELDFMSVPEIMSYGIFNYLDVIRERLTQIHESIAALRFGADRN